jgi:hypothetical protein
MNYDKSRVWLLGAFCVAAHKSIPHGADWAAKVLGAGDPPTTFGELALIAKLYRRPLYHILYQERVRFHADNQINAVMTGMRLLTHPVASRLTHSERGCIRTTMEFLKPVLEQGSEECRVCVEELARTILQDKDFSLAA